MKRENDTSRKVVVRKAAVIFLIAMVILTFFSNTIMTYSLPEVATEAVYAKTVASKVRGSGIVEANTDYEVKASGTRIIKEVNIKAGDKVEQNQVLFTFEEGENTELEEAEDALADMELNYAKSLLTMAPDYTQDNKSIQAAQKALNDAIKAQKEAKTNADKLKTAKKNEKAAQKKVDAQQAKVDATQKKIDGYTDAPDVAALEAQITADTRALTSMETQLRDMEDDYKTNPDTDLERQIRDQKTLIANAKTDLEKLKTALTAAKTVGSTLSTLKATLGTQTTQLTKDQTALASAKAEVESLSAKPTLAEANADVEAKKTELETLMLGLSDRKEQDGLNQQSTNMDLQAARENIEEQKQLVAKLKSSNDLKEIKAKDAGVVSMVNCKEGDTVPVETSMASIQLDTSGYVVNITVTKEQANLAKVGNEATIENLWGQEVTATLESMRVDAEKPNQNMILSFDVKGDINIGETVSLSVGEKSSPYETVVPNSAIREDNSGKFVLVVNMKGTPFGNRYKLLKVGVEVLASDDTYSAVSGGLYEGNDVVTNSTKPLETGMQVRLVNQ